MYVIHKGEQLFIANIISKLQPYIYLIKFTLPCIFT